MKMQQLIQTMAERTGASQSTVRAVLEALPGALNDLEVGEKVQTPIGVFTKKDRPSKTMKSIQTGEPVQTRAKVAITLKPSSQMSAFVD